MAEQDTTPVFNLQRIYLKDLSLEQPNTPQIQFESNQQQPQVDIQLGLQSTAVVPGVYEVAVTVTVTTKTGDRTLFLIEAKEAGLFEIRNLPDEQTQGILNVVCPQMIYPYLRSVVTDVCTRGGFPPIFLAEVNFQAMYEQQMAQRQAGNGAPN